MKKVDLKDISRIRKKHNKDLLRRMQAGESLKAFDSSSSWFPPRPVIRKDQDAIRRLYQNQGEKSSVSEQKGEDNLPDLSASGKDKGMMLVESDQNSESP